jgi:hypothetical protein
MAELVESIQKLSERLVHSVEYGPTCAGSLDCHHSPRRDLTMASSATCRLALVAISRRRVRTPMRQYCPNRAELPSPLPMSPSVISSWPSGLNLTTVAPLPFRTPLSVAGVIGGRAVRIGTDALTPVAGKIVAAGAHRRADVGRWLCGSREGGRHPARLPRLSCVPGGTGVVSLLNRRPIPFFFLFHNQLCKRELARR